MSHTNVPGVGGPEWSIYYNIPSEYDESDPDSWAINQALNYQLGTFIAHACCSGAPDTGVTSVAGTLVCADNGIYVGFEGKTFSSQLHAFVSSWGWKETSRFDNGDIKGIAGGRQGTRTLVDFVIESDFDLYPFHDLNNNADN